jgi:AbrB family looped-hinge helix DNA binding protein
MARPPRQRPSASLLARLVLLPRFLPPFSVVCHTLSTMARSAKAVPLRIGPQGRVVIPAELRRTLAIEPGETLMAHVEADRLVLERREQILERLRGELRGSVPEGVSMVDELIAERRAEVRRETAEHERGA